MVNIWTTCFMCCSLYHIINHLLHTNYILNSLFILSLNNPQIIYCHLFRSGSYWFSSHCFLFQMHCCIIQFQKAESILFAEHFTKSNNRDSIFTMWPVRMRILCCRQTSHSIYSFTYKFQIYCNRRMWSKSGNKSVGTGRHNNHNHSAIKRQCRHQWYIEQ